MKQGEPAAGYRLNWNPQEAPGDITAAHVQRVKNKGFVRRDWRCGNAAIEPGHPVYLVRTGVGANRGIIGAGEATAQPQGGHYDDDGEWVPRSVPIRLHVLSLEPFIPREDLDRPPFDRIPSWSNATPAGRLPADVVAAIEARLPKRPKRAR